MGLIGEIAMVAVDPAAQRRGIGSSLTEHATAWLCAVLPRAAPLVTYGVRALNSRGPLFNETELTFTKDAR